VELNLGGFAMRVKQFLLVITAITCLCSFASAGDFSFTGTFSDVNQVQYFTFTVAAGQKVVIQSYSYAGDSNAAGTSIQGGGFDPYISLFQGSGSSAPLFKSGDDEFSCQHIGRDPITKVCYDVYWEGTAQAPAPGTIGVFEAGTYTVALTDYANFTNGATLGDGFTNTGGGLTCAGNPRSVIAGTFADCLGNTRDGHWALDIKGVDTAYAGLAKPKLIVTAADASRTYGAGNPIVSGTLSGLQPGDSITATYASASDASSPVGTYSIVPTLVDPAGQLSNYNVVVNNGTLSVTPAALTVVAANASRYIGHANPALTGTITGVQNGDNITATYATAATTTSIAGSYAIVPTLVDPAAKLANYTVTATNSVLTVNPVPAPSVVSVTPNTGTGVAQVFEYAFSDVNGYRDIKTLWAQIGSSTAYPGSCAMMYDSVGNHLFLARDDASGWLPAITPGTATMQHNSQCTINAAASSVVGSGNNLTITVAYTFSSTYIGTKNVYSRAQSSSGLDSGWQLKGAWTTNTPAAVAPSVLGVTPSTGAGSAQMLQYSFSTINGYRDVKTIWAQVGISTSYPHSCATMYDAVNNRLYLIRDDASGWMPAIVPGSATTVQNSQCTINGSATTVVVSGNNITLNVSYSFTAAYAGAKKIYSRAMNQASLDSGWQLKGAWTVQ
jgi:hypothetical protein